ncbi:MAG: 1-acyl-sn-glycerol-3-phosphate acyltransferase [Candidatus Niyogibacteria bacterium]|nr:1-acyl-sn-glycerol-3-phosphate acyltransferase [Candidatus Niyogibacteria bacterium]
MVKVMTAKVFQMLCYWPIYLLLKCLVNYRVEGQENLCGLENRPVIFVSNHASWLDGFLCAMAMPRNGLVPRKFYPLRFLVTNRFMRLWDIRMPVAIFTHLNASIKVRRAGGDVALAMREAVEVLRSGAKVWMFPEGKFTLDGKIGRGKRGAPYLHRETGAFIVPVGISGHFDVLSERHIYKLGVKVRVNIGRPMCLPVGISLEEGSAIIMDKIRSLAETNTDLNK